MRRLDAVLLLTLMSPALGHVGGQTAAPTPADDFEAAAATQPLPEPAAGGMAAIRAARLAAHVAFLASPALEGRGLGTRGLDAAAQYVAAILAAADVPPLLRPSREGSVEHGYFQSVPLRELRDVAGEVTIERRAGGRVLTRTFRNGVDCLLGGLPPQSVSAPVVFAGYGIREPQLARDDYRDLDVEGKIVIIRAGLPPGDAWNTPELRRRYAADDPEDRWAAKHEIALVLGAAALIAVEGEAWAAQVAQDSAAEAAPIFLPLLGGESGSGRVPLIRASEAVAAACLGDEGLSGGSRDLAGVSATIRTSATERALMSCNVLAWLEGADPTLRDEAVILGAHMDHLGVIASDIHPGADDNASGVSALLEIARSFATLAERPKRTVILAFWTGEEEGKLGSGHYVRHPPWLLAHTAVYINLDMIGHPWLMDEIRVLVRDTELPGGEAFLQEVRAAEFAEAGLPHGAPELAEALRRAARAAGLALHLDHTAGTSGGSDYRDFARAGVPFIRFFGNFFPAYHEPGDTPEALDPEQVERIARLVFATAWLLAER